VSAVTAALLVGFGMTCAAADAPGTTGQPTVQRPRIGLVLSGGGARGAAHIGVLRVLDELHVPIDAIAGTSMGAVVGGLYASGLTAQDIETVMTSVNWQEAFRDRPPRTELDFRRKLEDRDFLVKYPLGISGGKLRLPKGLLQGQTLQMMLRRLTLPVSGIAEFDELPTRFRAVATDLATGEPVVMRAGDLATAMRASMSIPGALAPVERDGRTLVDGGITENLPIDVAREMGVDIVIVVDVGAPLYTQKELRSATTISNQMLAILIRRDSQRQLATLTSRDILVSPQLGDVSSFDFGIIQRAIAVGAAAGHAVEAQLRALAIGPEAYQAYVERRAAAREAPKTIEFVRIDPEAARYERSLTAAFDGLVGKPLDPADVTRRADEYFGRGNLELLDYRLLQQDNQYGLLLDARRNSWGPNYVRFGLSLQDDFEGNATYDAAARFVLSEITSPGGEWVWDLQMGDAPHVETEVYLPLPESARYFVLPHAQFDARNIPLIDPATQAETAEFRLNELQYGLDFGRLFGNWGELRVGYTHEEGHTKVRIGSEQPMLPTSQFRANGYFVRLSYDRLDSVNFPRSGQLATLEWNTETNALGSDQPFQRLQFNYLAAHSFGRQTALFWASVGTALDHTDPTNIRTLYPLGGFLNLSGRAVDSLEGPHYGIARLLFYRKIGRGGEGIFDFPAYLGVSFEAGNVWETRGDCAAIQSSAQAQLIIPSCKPSTLNWSSARKDGSIFLGLDTLVGPLYLATGFDEGGREAFYLFLGRTF